MFCRYKSKEKKHQGLKRKYIQGVQLKEEYQELKKGKYLKSVLSKEEERSNLKKDKERRHICNPYPKIDERKTSNEYILHPHFNNKIFFTYNEYNGKITWAKVPNR